MNDKNRVKENLLEKVKKFVDGEYSVEDFWNDFYIYFSTQTEVDTLDEYDHSFFLELSEVLYHTDWVSPPDPALKDPKELLSWVKENLPLYLNGEWNAEK